MIRRAALLLALATVGAIWSPAVSACSVSPSPKIRVEQLKDDPANRRVKGHFIVSETLIGAGGRGVIRGRIETGRGTSWDVWVDYDEFMIECVYFFAPTIDADGTFWIARQAVDGRYEIRLWEGEYTPEALERYRRQEAEADALGQTQ